MCWRFAYNCEEEKSLELLPLIKVKQDVNACYFYNRIENNNVRFISYHFEPEPEIHEDTFQDTAKVITDLLAQEKEDESI